MRSLWDYPPIRRIIDQSSIAAIIRATPNGGKVIITANRFENRLNGPEADVHPTFQAALQKHPQ